MPAINIGADFSQVDSEAKNLVNSLLATNESIQTISKSIINFNSAGDKFRGTLEGIGLSGDKFSAKIKGIRDATGQLNASLSSISFTNLSKGIEEANELHNVMNRLGRSLQYYVTYRAFSAIAGELREATQEANKFQTQISLIRTISQDSQQSFSKFGQDIRKVSDKSGAPLADVSTAFYNTTSNQIAKGANVAPFVEEASKLARVTGSTLPDAVNILSSTINAYGYSVKDAEKLSAQWFRTVDEGRVVLSEVGNTIGRVLVLGNQLGVAQEDLQATIAITTQKGFRATDALTLLTNILIKLEKPTQATAGFFASLGVDSGEAAIQLYGFTGVLQKMVDAVQSGQVDVSAFFDEIRGRKQFAVFQQSIGQIKNFSEELKNVGNTTKAYNDAFKITQESPADYLNRESNKLKNVFAVDFGQSILSATASVVKFFGGIEGGKNTLTSFGSVLTVGTGLLGTYGLTMAGIAAYNYAASLSFKAVGASATTAGKAMIPLLAIYGAYELTTRTINRGQLTVDNTSLQQTAELIKQINESGKALNSNNDKSALEQSISKINNSYKELLGITAQANLANNKLLDDAKVKSADAANNLKVSFGSYTTTLKDKISDFKKGITDANTEIEKSVKNTAKFKDNLDNILFSTKFGYADENQKIQLTEQRINELTSQAINLSKTGKPGDVEEARKNLQEVAKLQAQSFDLQVSQQKAHFQGIPGEPQILTVDTTPLMQRQAEIAQLMLQIDQSQIKMQEKKIANSKIELEIAEKQLKQIEDAFNRLEKLNPLNAQGKIDSRFKDKLGKFDPAKFEAESESIRKEILSGTNGSVESRIQLLKAFYDAKRTFASEAQAVETRDFLQNEQNKIQADRDRHEARLKQIDEERRKAAESQDNNLKALENQKNELGAFFNLVSKNDRIADPLGTVRAKSRDNAQAAIDKYGQAVADARARAKPDANGTLIISEEDVGKIASAFNLATIAIRSFNAELPKNNLLGGNKVDLTADGVSITGSEAANADYIKRLNADREKLKKSGDDKYQEDRSFQLDTVLPLDKLKAKFPELTKASEDATNNIKTNFKDAATGLQPLSDRLDTIIDKMKKLNLPIGGAQQGALVGDGLSEAYAAGGGIVGMFPGQPRGADRYPFWLAEGERIISAAQYAQFAPQIESILRNQQPRYASTGGVVGGDTHVGDINIQLDGRRSDDDNVQDFANKLRRAIKLGRVRL